MRKHQRDRRFVRWLKNQRACGVVFRLPTHEELERMTFEANVHARLSHLVPVDPVPSVELPSDVFVGLTPLTDADGRIITSM